MWKIGILDLTEIIEGLLTEICSASLNILHLSIIYQDKNHSYLDGNILFVHTIFVEYHITEEPVVFLLCVPLLDPRMYSLYHHYSIVTNESTTTIPCTPYVAQTT